MTGKIEFGCDYLYLMRELIFRASDSDTQEFDPVSDATARLFLVQWGFTIEEADQAHLDYWERLKADTLDTFKNTINRLVEHFKDNRLDSEQLIIQLAAIGHLDFHVSEEEGSFVYWFKDLLDFRESEFQNLANRGYALATALNYFGSEYARTRGVDYKKVK